MIALLTIFLQAASLGAVILSFFDPRLAWIVLFIQVGVYGAFFVGITSKKAAYVDELSPKANEHLRKYTHLYELPSVSKNISSALSACVLASILVGIVGAFSGFWIGLGIAAVYAFTAGKMAKALVPPEVLSNAPNTIEMDTEIRDWIRTRNSEK
jgi:hypothetical protein